ncbi:uncharacterized protein BDR25DRAFT_304952, partial [Lindgomyces ingoldianus]
MTSNTPIQSKGLTPSWAIDYYRRRKSSTKHQSSSTLQLPPSERPRSHSTPGDLLSPRSTSTSRSSESGESRSVRSTISLRSLVGKLRSPSSTTLVDLQSESKSPETKLPEFTPSEFEQIEHWFAGFAYYNQLVTLRVSKNQTGDPDVAFSNFTKIISKKIGGQFIHALPEAVFDLSLLWCPAGPLKRKDSTEPSWSWTGWDGPVNFPFDPTNSPDLLSMPRDEGEWFRSEILQYHIGSESAPYTIRREKQERKLRIHYPPYFHAPRGYDANADSDTLRFSAYTISADGFTSEQLDHHGKAIPCSHLINDDDQQCGVIMDFDESISTPSSTGPFEFVLVSRSLLREPASKTRTPALPTIHPPGTPIWANDRFVWDEEIVDFDNEVFPSGPWVLLNVILIKWVGNYAERVAVARIHENAWKQCKPVKRDIVL